MSSFFNTLLPELLKGQIWSLGGRMCHDGNFAITSTWNSHENISFNGCDLRVFKCSFQSILTTTGMCPALLSSRKMPLHRHGLSESIKPNLNENDCCIPRHATCSWWTTSCSIWNGKNPQYLLSFYIPIMYACVLVSSVQCMMRQFFQFAARYHLISFILEEDPIPKMPSNLCFGGINVGEYPGNAVQKFCDI